VFRAYVRCILGDQPSLNAELDALDWENTSVSAATSEITRGRVETRTIRALPAPPGTGFQDAKQTVDEIVQVLTPVRA
jgi:hypothetical protein